MANVLKMALQQAIVALWRRGWSFRRIADELGVHRETVSRYVRLDGEAAGGRVDEGAKPAKVTAGLLDGPCRGHGWDGGGGNPPGYAPGPHAQRLPARNGVGTTAGPAAQPSPTRGHGRCAAVYMQNWSGGCK